MVSSVYEQTIKPEMQNVTLSEIPSFRRLEDKVCKWNILPACLLWRQSYCVDPLWLIRQKQTDKMLRLMSLTRSAFWLIFIVLHSCARATLQSFISYTESATRTFTDMKQWTCDDVLQRNFYLWSHYYNKHIPALLGFVWRKFKWQRSDSLSVCKCNTSKSSLMFSH